MTALDPIVWVYFILCKRGNLYIGVSRDPVERFRLHASGKGAKSMRLLDPIKLLGALPFESRSEALQVEYHFKRLSHSRKLKLAEIASLDSRWQAFAQGRGCPDFVFRYSLLKHLRTWHESSLACHYEFKKVR